MDEYEKDIIYGRQPSCFGNIDEGIFRCDTCLKWSDCKKKSKQKG